MKRFKYYSTTLKQLETNSKWVSHPSCPEHYYLLDQFGEDGWELVSVIETFETGRTYFFKKEIENE